MTPAAPYAINIEGHIATRQAVQAGRDEAVSGVKPMMAADAATSATIGKLRTDLEAALEPYVKLHEISSKARDSAHRLSRASQHLATIDPGLAAGYRKNLEPLISNIGQVATSTADKAKRTIAAIEQLRTELDSINAENLSFFSEVPSNLEEATVGLDALMNALEAKTRQMEEYLHHGR